MNGGLWNRKLSDFTVGDVVKGWVAWVIGGAILSLIIGAIVLSSVGPSDPTSHSPGGDGAAVPTEGTAITPDQFRGVHKGDRKEDVIASLGKPAGTDSPMADVSPQYYSDCIQYRHARDETSMYVICFDAGRVFEKDAF